MGRTSALRGLDVEVALRAAIAVVVPLTVLVIIGRLDWAAYGAFGGMAAIFGRRERYRMRVRTVPAAAGGILVSVTAGTVLAAAAAPLWAEAAVLVGVIVLGILLIAVLRMAPPTPLFFVFGLLVCASVPTAPSEVLPRLLVAVLSAAFAIAVSLSGWSLRRALGPRGAAAFTPLSPIAPLRPEALRDRTVWLNIAQNVVAAVAAGAVAAGLGIGHPYWAVVGAVAVVPPPGAAHSLARAWHRVIGTLGGIVVAGLILWPSPPVAVLVIVVGVAQFAAEVLVGRHYGAALLAITPLALVVSYLSHPVALDGLLADRVVETLLGCLAGVVVVLLARSIGPRWIAGRQAQSAAPR
ncbi:MAG: FUSC family protein [Leifsonia sp.]